MKSKVYHGELDLDEFARALSSLFNRGPLAAQMSRKGDQAFVQIVSRPGHESGGKTSLGVRLRKVDDRLEVQVSDQGVLGIAGSLGASAILGLINPLNLLGRIDDIAQDFENLSLDDQVWEVIETLARDAGASHQLSDRLKRMSCDYCRVANPVGEGRCLACGAPLGGAQPYTCPDCGYVVVPGELNCPNCGKQLEQKKEGR